MLGSHPGEDVERKGDGIAAAALLIGPALALGPVVTFFVPLFGEYWALADIAFLALAPAVLSLAWRPGASRNRARWATAATAIVVGLELGFVGLAANPCVADPTFVGVTSAALAIGTFLVASAVGRSLAMHGRVVSPLIAAGAVGLVGFLVTAFWVLPQVLVLC
jgi:hypothetical protein